MVQKSNIFGDEDIFENFVLFFAFPFFSCKGKNDKDLTTPCFFEVRYDFLRRKNRHVFFGTNLFFGPSFSRGNENALVKNEP